MSETISLNDLIGEHYYLSGVEFGLHKWEEDWRAESNSIFFILDNITYEAIEDPCDNYRSCLDSIIKSDKQVKNTFPNHEVLCRLGEGNKFSNDNVIEFVDLVTDEVVLEIGTENYQDWYPCCVMRWCPENLAINQDK